MEVVAVKNTVLGAVAILGGMIAHQLGGWDSGLKVLIAMMIADYLTGLMVAIFWKRSPKSENGTLDSKAGFKGIVKKCVILLMVWISVKLMDATGADYVRTMVILFFVGNEGLSLLENVGLMGVPYPAFLKDILDSLRERGDGGKED